MGREVFTHHYVGGGCRSLAVLRIFIYLKLLDVKYDYVLPGIFLASSFEEELISLYYFLSLTPLSLLFCTSSMIGDMFI